MHTLQLNFRIFSFFGVWRPLKWSTGYKAVVYNCYATIIISFLYTFASSQFIDLTVSSENVKEFTHRSYMFLTVLAACGKGAVLLKQRKQIIHLTNVLRNDLCKPRNNDETEMQIEFERDARATTLLFSVITGTTASLITLRSLWLDIPGRNMPFKGWLPYDPKSSEIGYWLSYFHQLVAHATAAALNTSFDTLVPGFVQSICAQMNIFKYRIKSLPQIVENNEEWQGNRLSLESKLLAGCLRHHVQIFQLANSLTNIFSNIVFFQIVLSSLILCVSAYEASAMKLFSSEFTAIMMYLCCMIGQIFLYCFYGGELTFQSLGICDAVYQMDWSSLNIKTKKTMLVIMLRSLRPITFTCGDVITVSLDSFNSIIKLSYSVFNVLQQRSETV